MTSDGVRLIDDVSMEQQGESVATPKATLLNVRPRGWSNDRILSFSVYEIA